LGIFLDALGKWDEAIEYYRKSINIFNDTAITYELGRIMINQSVSEFMVYGPDKAIASCLQGVQFCSKDIRPQEYAYGMLNLCVFYLAKNDIVNARKILEQCDEWSIKERWYWLNLQQVKANLLRFEGKCNDALLLLENLVDEFNDLDDNWGEIDVIINRSCILIDMKSDEKIYLELIHKAFMLSQQRKYYLGMRINAYLLLKEEDISNLDQDIIELGNEFKKNHLHLFEGDIFVPCYVLLLRAKSILY
jgi:tetratricopeptide (TPR) repeat protein